MKESQLFDQVKRYQLPIGHRADTYSAILLQPLRLIGLDQGERVAVKGPFPTREKASVALKVNKLKSAAKDLLLVPLCVVALVPDLFADSRFRLGLDLECKCYFLVGRDLTAPLDLPMLWHPPSANFPGGLQVVDWAPLAAQNYHNSIPSVSTYQQSIYERDAPAARHLVQHVLLDWVFGVGGDLAFRNFIYPRSGVVYNIDTDNLGKMEWHLGNSQVCAARLAMGKFFRQFFETFDLEPLRQDLKSVDWTLMPKASRAEAQRRAALDREEILGLLVHKARKEKRDASPKRR